MDFTRIKLGNGRTVRVANEDVEAVEANEKDNADKVKNAVDPAKMQETMDQLAQVNKQLEDLTKTKTELEGQLQALKDQLDAVMAPAAVEEAAAAMNAERADGDKVMNAHGLKLSDEQRKLHGPALRAAVVNAVRVKNGKPELTADQLKDAAYVRGMFSGYLETAGASTVPPAGHQVVNTATTPNATGEKQHASVINGFPNADKFKAMYGQKEKA